MGIRTKGWLIITGVGLMFAAIGWFAYQQGSFKALIGAVGSVLIGGGVGLQIWLRQRRFEREASSGFVLIRDAAVPGARLPVRVMPNDLSIIHLPVPAEEAVGGRARSVEARVSQTPLTTYA